MSSTDFLSYRLLCLGCVILSGLIFYLLKSFLFNLVQLSFGNLLQVLLRFNFSRHQENLLLEILWHLIKLFIKAGVKIINKFKSFIITIYQSFGSLDNLLSTQGFFSHRNFLLKNSQFVLYVLNFGLLGLAYKSRRSGLLD